ncbi:unnamed protein product [Calypogeia fissa]
MHGFLSEEPGTRKFNILNYSGTPSAAPEHIMFYTCRHIIWNSGSTVALSSPSEVTTNTQGTYTSTCKSEMSTQNRSTVV